MTKYKNFGLKKSKMFGLKKRYNTMQKLWSKKLVYKYPPFLGSTLTCAVPPSLSNGLIQVKAHSYPSGIIYEELYWTASKHSSNRVISHIKGFNFNFRQLLVNTYYFKYYFIRYKSPPRENPLGLLYRLDKCLSPIFHR